MSASGASTNAITIEALHAGYGPIEVLHGVDIKVGEGEVVALIGANGAGKTTTLLAVMGVVQPSGGQVRVFGEDVTGLATHEIVARGVALVPEGRRVFPRLSVEENLRLGAWPRRNGPEASPDEVYGLFPILAERRAQPAGTLSGGEQQMLAMGRALMARPRILILDEPSLGLAPLMAARIFEVIRDLAGRGVPILLVEQNARAALRLAARGYVLEAGTVALSGTGGALLSDQRVRSVYLGE